MSYEEKDWIMRQIKQIASGIGKFLGKSSVKEIVNLQLSESAGMTDQELDDVLLLIAVEEKIIKLNLSDADFLERTSVERKRFNVLLKDYTLLGLSERESLRKFSES